MPRKAHDLFYFPAIDPDILKRDLRGASPASPRRGRGGGVRAWAGRPRAVSLTCRYKICIGILAYT